MLRTHYYFPFSIQLVRCPMEYRWCWISVAPFHCNTMSIDSDHVAKNYTPRTTNSTIFDEGLSLLDLQLAFLKLKGIKLRAWFLWQSKKFLKENIHTTKMCYSITSMEFVTLPSEGRQILGLIKQFSSLLALKMYYRITIQMRLRFLISNAFELIFPLFIVLTFCLATRMFDAWWEIHQETTKIYKKIICFWGMLSMLLYHFRHYGQLPNESDNIHHNVHYQTF